MRVTQLAVEADLERPTVDVIPGVYMAVVLRGRFGGVTASLDGRAQRLVAAALRHVRDARALGGMAVTVELADPGFAQRRAAAVMVSADAKSLVLAFLDRAGRPLAAARLDQATVEKLSGDPT